MSSLNQPATFAEANIALQAKLLGALQTAVATTGGSASGPSHFTPTPLLVRVLRRTAVDFADVIVDGRCATGSRQVGSAAAVWVHHNAAARSAGGGSGGSVSSNHSSPATVTATTAAAGGSSSSSAAPNTSAASNTSPTNGGMGGAGGVTPLYYTDAALSECRQLLAVYSLHCLLTASNLFNATTSSAQQHVHPAADGRVRQLPGFTGHWTPEVSIIVAETEASAEELLRLCRSLAEACNCGVQVSLALGSKSPSSLIVRPLSATATASSSSSSAGAGGKESKVETDANKKEEAKKKGLEWPFAASLIITTTHSFLNWNLTTLLNTGVDISVADENPEVEAAKDKDKEKEKEKDKDAGPRSKRVFPHIASVVVEEIARATASSAASAEKVMQQWRDVHTALNAAMLRQHVRYSTPAHLYPHFMWICRGPVSRLPSSLRQLLSRRSRRYYQLQPSTYISSAAVALMPQPQEGLSTPAESLGIRLVLSQNTADKDAQLRRIVTDRSGLYHRVLILTHNKEVPQLSSLIASWGVSRDPPSTTNTMTSSNANAGGQPAITAASPNFIHSTRRMDSLVAQHQCHAAYLNCCEAAERATLPATTATTTTASGAAQPSGEAAAAPSTSSPVVVTLAAWDAFTALDVMDVDVIVQYYPPQKSLTEQEWAEFIQLLHTTVDGEREIELSLRQNRNNKEDNIRAKLSQLLQATTTGSETQEAAAVMGKAANLPTTTSSSSAPSASKAAPHRPLPVLVTLMVAADFTLTAYFLYQYLYSGASGILTFAATATSLTSTVPTPGKPDALEPVEHPLPVLDISPRHPYFIPLVCGHDGGAEWPEAAAGSPPRARVTPLEHTSPNGAAAPLLTRFTSGEPVTIRRVLEAKLAKKHVRAEGHKSPQGSSTATSPTASGAAAAASPLMLLAQGNVSMGGSNTGAFGGGGGVKGAGGSGTESGHHANSSNLARLMKNATGGYHANSNGAVSAGGGGGGGGAQRGHGGKDGAGSATEANTSTTSGAGGGKAAGNNSQRSNNNNNNNRGSGNNKGGSGGPSGMNSSSTASSVVTPAVAAAAAAAAATSGSGRADHHSPSPAATSPSSKAGNGEKSGGGNRRRVRSGRAGNANSGAANSNAGGGNNNNGNGSGNKKGSTQPTG